MQPLKHVSLDRTQGNFFAPSRTDSSFACPEFILILKPYPRHLVGANGEVDEARLLPPWLPFPPHPATHQGRHLRATPHPPPPSSFPTVEEQGESDRWEPLPPTITQSPKDRPIMRVLTMSSKKRIHKLAVIRNRARTRLVAALRQALWRLPHPEASLGCKKNVLMIIANPPAYSTDMAQLIDSMEKGLHKLPSYARKKPLPTAPRGSAHKKATPMGRR